MSKLQQAGEAVRHLAKQYRAVIELGAHLEALGALENLEAEINVRVEKAREAEAAALEAQKIAEVDLDLALSNAESVTQQAHADAAQVVKAAEQDAARIRKQAEEDAKSVEDAIEKRKAGVEHDLAVTLRVLTERNGEIKQADAKLAALRADYEALRAKLA